MSTTDRIARDLGALSAANIRYQPTSLVLDYWLRMLVATGSGALPGFDPLDVPTLLPHIYLLQRHGDRLRYRVSGEAVNDLFGSNHTGKHLDAVVPPEIYPHVAPYFMAVFERKVCIFKGHVLLAGRDYLEFERVLLPIERNGEVHLLGSLALSSTSPLRKERAVAPPPAPGFHFTLYDLGSGTTDTSRITLAPLIRHSGRARSF